jgi:hypothetical protein
MIEKDMPEGFAQSRARICLKARVHRRWTVESADNEAHG